MRSKLALVFAVALSLALTACFERIAPQVKVISSSGCIKRVSGHTQNFYQGKSNHAEIDQFFDCIDQSLKTFQERTQGEKPGVFSQSELKKFVEAFLIPSGKVIPTDLWNEILFAKTIFVGGEEQTLTLDELKKFQNLVSDFRHTAHDTVSYFPLLSAIDQERFDPLANRVGGQLKKLFADPNQPYPLPRFRKLLATLGGFLEAKSFADFLKSLDLGISIYQLSFQPLTQTPFIGVDQVDDLVKISSIGARLYRNYRYYTSHDDSVFYGKGLSDVTDSLLTVLDGVQKVLDSRYSYYLKTTRSRRTASRISPITLSEIGSVIDLYGENLKSIGIQSETLKGILEPLLIRVLGGVDTRLIKPELKSNLAIDHAWITRLRSMVNNWNQSQKLLTNLYRSMLAQKIPATAKNLSNELFSPNFVTRYLDGNQGQNTFWDLDSLIQSSKPLYGDRGMILRFTERGFEENLTFNNLSQLNWIRLFSKSVVHAYASGDGFALTRDDFKTLIDQIYQIGIELKFFDPLSTNSDKKRFMEANLFTPSSTGDNFLDAHELTELLAMLTSASDVGSSVHDQIAKICPRIEGTTYGYPYVQASCFREHFRANFESYIGYMPRLLSYYDSLSPQERTNFHSALEKAGNLYVLNRKVSFGKDSSGKDLPEEFVMSEDDMHVVFALLQYIEVIFYRFDLDNSGTLDIDDVALSFKEFKTELRAMTSDLAKAPENRVYGVYVYLLARGEIPSTLDIVWNWMLKNGSGLEREVHADRMRILQVFGAMMKKVRESGAKTSNKPKS